MAVESIVALALATAFLVGLSWYASHHRAEDKDKKKDETKDHQEKE